MTDRVRIRVSMTGDKPTYELMVEEKKVTELSWIEVLELSVQSTSTLRWVKH